jgi:hypothetical protein
MAMHSAYTTLENPASCLGFTIITTTITTR